MRVQNVRELSQEGAFRLIKGSFQPSALTRISSLLDFDLAPGFVYANCSLGCSEVRETQCLSLGDHMLPQLKPIRHQQVSTFLKQQALKKSK